MGNESGDVYDLRPYKIFMSLLDKWEIGFPLTDVLIIDALKAISRRCEADTSKLSADVRLTNCAELDLTCHSF